MPRPDPALFDKFKSIRDHIKANCRDLERWPSYFDRRYYEFLSYFELLPEDYYPQILELGCGIGYQSAFLALISDKVTATDLPDEDIKTHTAGIEKARQLQKCIDIQNVEFIGTSAENLPFADNSFSMVFNSHVLEHIPDKVKALREIYRVLKPGGIHFCVVPASSEKFYSFFNYYLYILKRSIYHLFKKISGKNKSRLIAQNKIIHFERQLKSFPFPPSHGHSKSFISEYHEWKPDAWKNLILENAPFILLKQQTTQSNPLLPMLGTIFPKGAVYLHSLTRSKELKYGHIKFLKSVGINSVMIFQKPDA